MTTLATAIGAMYALAAPACAQVSAEASAPANQSADATDSQVVVVTGSARPQRRFDVSYAVNSLSQSEVQKLAPLNMADLLGKMPGIQVEATGGEVQNVTRVRGIPTDDGYALFQQDGLPLFTEINGFFFRGDSMNRYDLMTKTVEVVPAVRRRFMRARPPPLSTIRRSQARKKRRARPRSASGPRA
jgi:hypothetical protein